MNNEQLSEILECMAYALNSTDKLYHRFTPADVADAKRKLDKLIKHDMPKKPIFGTHKIIRSMGFFCPDCNLEVNQREHLYSCKCGQRLDWSE